MGCKNFIICEDLKKFYFEIFETLYKLSNEFTKLMRITSILNLE
jgi:hypothetical protein